ncbi:tetratricopeptide repeat protein [Micromonospora sp. NPDC049580]|uniref:tetratricopeptide repeat protein n=1 Tax=Micromonospora sp. NPDC049580 TaxID=3154832 RepID=UPI003414352E
MSAEVTVGVISAIVAVAGLGVSYLQLRRTSTSSALRWSARCRAPIVIGDVPREPLAYTRRAALLEELARAVANGPVTVLTGGRGVGKTHLVATYTRESLARRLRLVLWVVAEDAAAITTALAAVACEVKLVDTVVDADAAAKAALRWIEQRTSPSLIVLDNALDPDAVLPWLPRRGQARVLITTTNRDFAQLGTEVRVAVFTPAQAAAFLCTRSGLDDLEQAALVAHELGDLPLALSQAGAVIRRRRQSFRDYLAGLSTGSLTSMLARVPGDDYPDSVEQATLRSIADAEAADPTGVAQRIVDLMALLSPAGVRRDLLYYLPIERFGVDDALATLAGASVVGFDVTGTVVVMHRLTRRFALTRMRTQGRVRAAAQEATRVLGATAAAAPPSGTDVVDHVADVWAAMYRDLNGDPEAEELLSELLRLRRWSVERLGILGESSRSLTTAFAVLKEHQNTDGIDDEAVFLARRALINAGIGTHRELDVLAFAEEALADRMRVHGPDEVATVAARNSLGYCCECAGLLERALEIHRYNLQESLRICGPDARSTMAARINIASTLRSMGRNDDAVLIFEENLRENIRVYGPEHESTINARGELARAYVRAGRAAEAVMLHEINAVLRRAEAAGIQFMWWPQYRAAAYSAAGRHGEAIALLRGLVEQAEAGLPRDNPSLIRLRLFLARALLAAGQGRRAMRLFERVVQDRERVLGADHTASLNARRNLGLALAVRGQRRRAASVLTDVLADYIRVLGETHPYAVSARSSLEQLPLLHEFPP